MTVELSDFRRYFALAGVSALLLTACNGNNDDEDAAGADGDPAPAADADLSAFTIAWHAQPPTLDPVSTTAGATHSLAQNVFEPLFITDLDGELQPVLAESWEVSEDATTFVFTLRDDVTFHDGSPLTAEDVAASMERWMEVSNSGQEFFGESDVEVTDDLEVTLTLGEPMYSALFMFGNPNAPLPIMPASVAEEAPETGVENEDIIGTGPYKFGEWVADQRIVFELNEDYTAAPGEPSGYAGDRTGTFETLVYEIVTDSSTAVTGIQTGEYDAAMHIPLDNVEQLENDPNLDLVVNDSIAATAALFNKDEGPMSDPTMRQAVAAALDYDEVKMAGYVDERFYTLNGSMMFEDSPWYTEAGLESFSTESDPDRAQELMDEAGYDGEPIRILTSRDYEEYYHLAVIMEQQLEEVGMNAELIVVDWPTLLEIREDASAHEISTTTFSYPVVPGAYLFLMESYAGWTDDEAISEAVDSMIYSPDEETALEANDALQEAFYEYLPIIKFGDHNTVTAVQQGFAGYDQPQGHEDLFFRVYPTE